MRIVIEGCGQWAMQYLRALQNSGRHDLRVTFTFDSTFGLDSNARNLPAKLFFDYLKATLDNVEKVAKAGYACIDVKDTLFKMQGTASPLRERLPNPVDAVFVLTPDRTHCDVAEKWLGKAKWIFVEKPFDASSQRIKSFCERLENENFTSVFAIDHYFVRCNQAASHSQYFLNHLLGGDDAGSLQGDFTAFEFYMTEPPVEDRATVRARALSLQAGMIFDLGSHALPVLLPFIDLSKPPEVINVWAGVSTGLRDVIYSGAETFSAVTLKCQTRSTPTKTHTNSILGTFVVGKDIGKAPQKYLRLAGPNGQVQFDLVKYCVYHENRTGMQPIAFIPPDWAQFFIDEVIHQRLPKSIEQFKPQAALRVIEFLENWRRGCERVLAGGQSQLALYKPGENAAALMTPNYQLF